MCTAKRKIYKNSKNSFSEQEDLIAIEKRLKISLNGKEVLSLYCTPLMVKELVVGMFMSADVIKGKWCAEMISIEYGEDIIVDIPVEGEVSIEMAVITSGCMGGITFLSRSSLQKIDDPFYITAKTLKGLFKRFQNAAELHKLTGCLHNAGLSDGNGILCRAEDIGRHNAVDKAAGYAALRNIPFKGKLMLTSGRLSSEIVSKCAKWGIPMIASRTSPTSLALDIAEDAGLTTVGFIRGDRLNVYTHPWRIK